MKKVKLFDKSGRETNGDSAVRIEKNGGTETYFVSFSSDENLNPRKAAEISFSEDFNRFVAEYMFSPYWCQPRFGKSGEEIPQRTQVLALEKKDGYKVILTLVGSDLKTFVEGDASGFKAVLFSLSEIKEAKDSPFMVTAEGKELKPLIYSCFKKALELNFKTPLMRDDRVFPKIFENLGWCTWDALQIRVSDDGIKSKIEEFKSKNIPVKYVIIDDMWADCTLLNDIPREIEFQTMVTIQHESEMRDFVADKTRFAGGLKETVAYLHENGVKVGIWYPVTGYWHGIKKGGSLYENIKDCLITVSGGRIVVAPKYKKARKFFDYVNGILKDAGVDFIKVDNQSCYELYYEGVKSIGSAAREFQRAIEDSAYEYFGGNIINCMGMDEACMLNREKSAVSRSSDDFMPENAAWFSKHILQCSYNSLFYGEVYYSDWDMWWTDDGQAGKNALLRAISGGPVYVSDKIGRSNADVLKALAFSDGKIPRADGNLVPTMECVFDDLRKKPEPFGVFNKVGETVVLAAFDLNEGNLPVSGKISLSQFGFCGDVVVYDYFGKSVKILGKDDEFRVKLRDNGDYGYYIITPLKNGVAAIGDLSKFLAPATYKALGINEYKTIENGKFTVYAESDGEIVLNGKKRFVKAGLNEL